VDTFEEVAVAIEEGVVDTGSAREAGDGDVSAASQRRVECLEWVFFNSGREACSTV
jgi:hypothetical protein